jgi:hypothetical protein
VLPLARRSAPGAKWRLKIGRMPGVKTVFFDIGWDSPRLGSEVRHDPTVRIMADEGPGWAAFGRPMTLDYVTRTIDRDAEPGMMFFYHLDAIEGSRVFADAFVPAMTRHRCARLYERAVPTYLRDDRENDGARLYGYRCAGP